MKKLLLTIFYVMLASVTQAQQYAVYATPAGVVKPLPNGQVVHITAGAGGALNQIQWNNAGLLDGFTMTGDMTLAPSTGLAVISAGVVSNSKLAQMPAATIKGNGSLSAGDPQDLTVAQAKTLLAISTGDVSGLGTMATQSAGAVAITGGSLSTVSLVGTISNSTINNSAVTNTSVTGLPAPVNPSDAVRKVDLDNVSSGITQRTSVAVATTANISLTGEQTIDGVLTSSSRILVKNQTLTENNGIYVTAAGAWARATDSNTAAELLVGYYYFVSSGSTQGSTGWTIQTAPTVLGTDPVVFSQFSASASYTAGAGISLVGNVFSNSGVRSNAGTANEITVSSPTGTNTISLPSALTFTGKTVTGGTFNSGAFNGTIGATTPSSIVGTTITSTNTLTATIPGSGTTLIVNGGVGALTDQGGQIKLVNQGTAAPTPNKYIRVDSSGAFNILNSSYGGGLFTLPDASAGSITFGLINTPIGATGASTGAFTTLSGSVTATGSVTSRTLASRFANVINVKDFGAVGNGVTDDTAAIQAAIATAVSGSVIYFPQAQVRYNCTGFSVPASLTNVLIKGDQAQIYQPTNGNNQLIIPNTCSYVTVDGIWFNGVGSARANGIHIRTGADYTTIRNCRFEASSDWGIQVDSAGAAVKGFVCENNYFKDTLGDGVHVMNVDGFRISNNTFWQCGDDAIAAITQSTTIRPLNGVISDNYIYGRTTSIAGVNTHGFRGIAVFIGRNILIEGNNIYNTYAEAIDIDDEYNSSLYNEGITVRNNSCYGCNVNGGPLGTIQMYFCKKSVCSGNTIVDSVNASGISFTDCSVLDISENSISQSLNQFCRGIVNNGDASYQGRTITASNDVIISDNKFWLTQASNNEAIYLSFTTGARCNNLTVASNKSRSTALAYITTDWIITGKFVNNVTIGGTTTPSTGGNSTGITSTNNL